MKHLYESGAKLDIRNAKGDRISSNMVHRTFDKPDGVYFSIYGSPTYYKLERGIGIYQGRIQRWAHYRGNEYLNPFKTYTHQLTVADILFLIDELGMENLPPLHISQSLLGGQLDDLIRSLPSSQTRSKLME